MLSEEELRCKTSASPGNVSRSRPYLSLACREDVSMALVRCNPNRRDYLETIGDTTWMMTWSSGMPSSSSLSWAVSMASKSTSPTRR
jgi:hypothetical protein